MKTVLEEIKESFGGDELGIINRVLVAFIACLIVVGLSTLTGCSLLQKNKEAAVPEGSKTVKFDAALLKECGKLPRLNGTSDTEVKDFVTATVQVFVECSTNKRKLNAEVKKAFNIP